MPLMKISLNRSGLAAACLLAGAVCAATPKADPPGDLLRGPEVPRNVVERIGSEDGNGRFVRVEGRPEFAAVSVLQIPADVRERVRQLQEQRLRDVTMHLVDELDLVRVMSDAVIEGDNETARRLMGDLWSRLEPGSPHAPCAGPIEALLPADQRATYRRVLDDYWSRWIESESSAMRPGETRERLAGVLFQEEVREAYDRSLRHYREAMDGIYGAVDPTEAQREAIRTLVIDHIKRTRLEATSADRRAVMLEVHDMLDEERRRRFVDYLLRVVIPDGA